MNVHRLIAAVLLLATLFATPHAARAAQSYDNCAGFIDALPATISTQGVWCLRKDLSTAIASGNAITIANNNVTIDCNDFKIGGLAAGPSSQAIGIFANNRQNAVIRHCGIRGFYEAIYLNGGAGHLVEDNRLDNNLYTAIRIYGDNNLVQRNRIYDTGGLAGGFSAIGIYASADVIDNVVSGVFNDPTVSGGGVTGITLAGNGDTARGNRVHDLTPSSGGQAFGIDGPHSSTTAVDNQVVGDSSNTGAGINLMNCKDNIVTGISPAYSCDATTVDTRGNMTY